jgi:TPP-dependent pyruvate/acetoin dehydrogenase alpha subunit
MRGLIHGTMHLSIGQEASAVGATLPLRRDDYILSTHRGHGHCLAKGADPARMLAEFFGKETATAAAAAARCTSPTSTAAISARTASSPAGCRSPWASA